jgi:hypothetical protein
VHLGSQRVDLLVREGGRTKAEAALKLAGTRYDSTNLVFERWRLRTAYEQVSEQNAYPSIAGLRIRNDQPGPEIAGRQASVRIRIDSVHISAG